MNDNSGKRGSVANHHYYGDDEHRVVRLFTQHREHRRENMLNEYRFQNDLLRQDEMLHNLEQSDQEDHPVIKSITKDMSPSEIAACTINSRRVGGREELLVSDSDGNLSKSSSGSSDNESEEEGNSSGHDKKAEDCCLYEDKKQSLKISTEDAEDKGLGPLRAPKLLTIHLRYYPPGLILEYVDEFFKVKFKQLDLLELYPNTNIGFLCSTIINSLPSLFCKPNHQFKLMDCLEKLRVKSVFDHDKKRFASVQTLKPHSLPLTDACISKDGSICVTSCLGNAAKIWNTESGNELETLIGHKHGVSSVSFNNVGDQLMTSSYDGTLRFWSLLRDSMGVCMKVIKVSENSSRVLFSKYSSDGQLAVTAADDNCARVHDVISGATLYKFLPQLQSSSCQQISSLSLDKTATCLLASPHKSSQAVLWDLRCGEIIAELDAHTDQLSKSLFNFQCSKILTHSLDGTARLWDMRKLQTPSTVFQDEDELLDISLENRGSHVAGVTTSGHLLKWNLHDGRLKFRQLAFKSPLTKVLWNPSDALILTCSNVGTVSLHHGDTGDQLQTLPDHTRSIVNANFSYNSEYLLTCSKDKSVRIHKLSKLC